MLSLCYTPSFQARKSMEAHLADLESYDAFCTMPTAKCDVMIHIEWRHQISVVSIAIVC